MGGWLPIERPEHVACLRLALVICLFLVIGLGPFWGQE